MSAPSPAADAPWWEAEPPGSTGHPVVIWGAGAMGGSVGARLHRAGRRVLLVDTDAAHVAAIREHGLRVMGPVDDFVARVPAVTPEEVGSPAGGPEGREDAAAVGAGSAVPRPPFRTVLLAVKAHHTAGAVRELAPRLDPAGCVVSVQNGLNERVIAAAVGAERTVGCFVNFGADVVEPGVVMRGNRGAVVIGELDGGRTPRVRALHALLRDFEPDALLTDDIHGYLWGKLAYGAILFATALTDASIADVLDSERHRPGLIALGREVCAVAAARGIRPRGFDGFDPSPLAARANAAAPAGAAVSDVVPAAAGSPSAEARAMLDALSAFNRASAKSHSGVWRDLAVRKRKTEVDAQIAVVSELGAEAGVATPLVDRLVELVHDVEEGRRRQSWRTLDALLATVLLVLSLAACGPSRAELAARYPLVPAPVRMEPADGEFRLDRRSRIVLANPMDEELRRVAEAFAEPIRRASGLPLPVEEGAGDAGGAGSAPRNLIFLRVTTPGGTAATDAVGLPPTADEAYTLSVDPRRISLTSPTRTGILRGLTTLRQLLPPELERGVRSGAPWGQVGGPSPARGVAWAVPAVEITDEPRFRWRGMHLDVGRHFFPVEFVKKYVDLLALHRMNVFHWHLTEDQGWRIEIDAYPLLTEVGGCRAETMVAKSFDPYVGDGERYCGSYTKEEVREVVAYAAERGIMVVPEIEMPGHSLAALAAYPELACTPGPFEVGTRWGVYEDIYCPTEETFAFLETVLAEVIELFPAPYVHIGGDEAPKARWEASPEAQAVMRREGLADEAELQSWFVRRIERFLNARGRRLVGWDEILEGGLAPDATVMSWRGMEGGIEAARQGHDVVMTPTSHAYFDYYQGDADGEPLAIGGFTPLEKVYAFEPVPPALTGEEARHVLGAQGNVWTEYMTTPGHVEYMALPRMAALAEVVWSPADARDPEGFLLRLEAHLRRLEELGVRYRPPSMGDAGAPRRSAAWSGGS